MSEPPTVGWGVELGVPFEPPTGLTLPKGNVAPNSLVSEQAWLHTHCRSCSAGSQDSLPANHRPYQLRWPAQPQLHRERVRRDTVTVPCSVPGHAGSSPAGLPGVTFDERRRPPKLDDSPARRGLVRRSADLFSVTKRRPERDEVEVVRPGDGKAEN